MPSAIPPGAPAPSCAIVFLFLLLPSHFPYPLATKSSSLAAISVEKQFDLKTAFQTAKYAKHAKLNLLQNALLTVRGEPVCCWNSFSFRVFSVFRGSNCFL